MTHRFEQGLRELTATLAAMGARAEEAVQTALRALSEREDRFAREVEARDDLLDHFELEVDEKAIALLAQAPLATDLRLITVAMKISHDLERVGDEATAIARRALELNSEPQLTPGVDLRRMADMALEMLNEALAAFLQQDPGKARAVIPRDKQVDALNKQMQRELVNWMVETPATITRCLNLLNVSKRLERIADHATNIAEEVVYLCEARDIRHAARQSGAGSAGDRATGAE